MMYLQIIVSVFVALVIAKIVIQRNHSRISNTSFLTWMILWLLVLVVFWQPAVTSYLALWLGIGRGADLVVYVAIVVIFYLQFKIYSRLNRIDTEITKLVRKDALDERK